MYEPELLTCSTFESAPEPSSRPFSWRKALAAILSKNPDSRWGAQLMRISSDMIVVCDEELRICHHNRAFLKAIGHSSGSFCGQLLASFLPEADREGVLEAFDEWGKGHAAGMRYQSPFLTTRGIRVCDVRVVRSRDRRGSFFYYMVARDAAKARRSTPRTEEQESGAFLGGLPMAAWRTDAALCITRTFGNLWSELGSASENLIGQSFGETSREGLPAILKEIDCSDVLAGMSLQTEVVRQGETFSVSVEPFLNNWGRVVGTVGMLRRSLVPVDGFRSGSHSGSRDGSESVRRHHLPPWNSGSAISIVTRRVPRFSGDDGESGDMDAIRSFSTRDRGSAVPKVRS